MHKLGKLNSSIDVIPLQGSSSDGRLKAADRHRPQDCPNRGFYDPQIISRVQAYMYENVDKTYIDINEMANYLQKKHRDYRGRKRSPFRAMVRRAYDEINESFGKKAQSPHWQDNEEDDDEVDLESDSQSDVMGNTVIEMYKRNTAKRNGNSSDKELINISSDEEQSKVEEIPPKKTKQSKNTEEGEQKNLQPALTTSISTTSATVTPEREVVKALPGKEELKVSTLEKLPKKRQREKEVNSRQNTNLFAKKKKEIPVVETRVKFADIGGSTKVLETVCKLLVHIKHPEVFKQLGISPPRGFLLHGPPGCGKTLLAHAIAGEMEIPLLKVAAPELIAGVSGESEARVRELFEQAIAISPCVLFLDEVDAIAPHRANAQKEMERRIVAQLLSCLDDLGSKENGNGVLVLGATNRPDALDPALRRAGRFDREVSLGIPDRDARAGILAVHAAKLALAPDVSLSKLAELTPGFVGADLVALIREAATAAVSRVFEQIKKKSNEVELIKEEQVENNVSEVKNEVQKNGEEVLKESQSEDNIIVDGDEQAEATTSGQRSPSLLKDADLPNPAPVSEIDQIQAVSKSQELTGLLTWLHDEPPLSAEYLAGLFIEHGDFEVALQVVQPSAKREGFATVPDVTWDDVGSLQDIRQELQMAILAPVRHSEHFAALGLTSPTGLLLCGPPGCGKTLLAKAIANEAGINFISVKGPELLNMYVGESEKAVRQCFIRARNSAPCVIFFDELDALCPKRSEGDSSATSRVVNQMLTEMDGVEARRGVFLMAASNRPDIIDPAVLRPGRLDKIIYVGLPTASDRIDILRALTKNGTKPKLAVDVDLEQVGSNSRCDGYTGADLAALIREAGMEALRESMTGPPGLAEVCTRHITAAFDKIRPSVHEKDVKHYETLRKLFSVVKKSSEVTPMETPIDAPLVDTTMEAMET